MHIQKWLLIAHVASREDGKISSLLFGSNFLHTFTLNLYMHILHYISGLLKVYIKIFVSLFENILSMCKHIYLNDRNYVTV